MSQAYQWHSKTFRRVLYLLQIICNRRIFAQRERESTKTCVRSCKGEELTFVSLLCLRSFARVALSPLQLRPSLFCPKYESAKSWVALIEHHRSFLSFAILITCWDLKFCKINSKIHHPLQSEDYVNHWPLTYFSTELKYLDSEN